MSARLRSMTGEELSTSLLTIIHSDKEYIYERGSYSLHDLLMLMTVTEILSNRGIHTDNPIVPTPYGSLTPSLEDCNYVNEWLSDDKYLDIVTCPNCESSGVVILARSRNPQLVEEQSTLLFDRFFCISCQESWCYERER